VLGENPRAGLAGLFGLWGSEVAEIEAGNPVLALWLAHASKKLHGLAETIDLSAPYCVCCWDRCGADVRLRLESILLFA